MKQYTMRTHVALPLLILAVVMIGGMGVGMVHAQIYGDAEVDTEATTTVDVETPTATTTETDDADTETDADAETPATTTEDVMATSGEVEGEVTTIEDEELVIETSEGARTISLVGGRLAVTRNGAQAAIDDIEPGDTVTVETEMIEEFSGEVVASEDGSFTVRDEEGNEEVITEETGATYERNGEVITFGDIQEGDTVTVFYDEPQEMVTIAAESVEDEGNTWLWIILLIILALLVAYALTRGASPRQASE